MVCNRKGGEAGLQVVSENTHLSENSGMNVHNLFVYGDIKEIPQELLEDIQLRLNRIWMKYSPDEN